MPYALYPLLSPSLGLPLTFPVWQVLSHDNQHELAVLARKFGNLHVYGCWWFCNVPSLISNITKMRLELLGVPLSPSYLPLAASPLHTGAPPFSTSLMVPPQR